VEFLFLVKKIGSVLKFKLRVR